MMRGVLMVVADVVVRTGDVGDSRASIRRSDGVAVVALGRVHRRV